MICPVSTGIGSSTHYSHSPIWIVGKSKTENEYMFNYEKKKLLANGRIIFNDLIFLVNGYWMVTTATAKQFNLKYGTSARLNKVSIQMFRYAF